VKQIITQSDDRSWRGMCLLRFDSFPTQLEEPQNLLSDLLDMLADLAVSAELMVTGDEKSDDLQCCLILRWRGVYRKETERRMSQETEMILKKLEMSGIRPTGAETIEEIENCLDRIRTAAGRKTGEDRACVSFFPAEHISSGPAGPAYLPGCWAAGGEKIASVPETGTTDRGILSWVKLLKLLSSYPCFCFSVQIRPTTLTREERTEIGRNIQWADSVSAGTEKDKPDRFHVLEAQKDSRLFDLTVWTAGKPEMIRYLVPEMKRKGLKTAAIPPLFFNRPGYMINGDQQISGFMDYQGHEDRYRNGGLSSGLRRLNRLATADEVQVFLPLPKEPEQINGLRIHRETGLTKTLLPERMRKQNESILIGEQESAGQKVYCPISSLSRHGCIVGKPGSGKTTFALWLLHQVHQKGIPFLAIEPAKREYRSLITAIPELQVYTPGNNAVSPLEMNLFLPPSGVTLEEYLPCVDQIFDLAFSMTSLLKDVFTKVIRRCYNRYNWRGESTRDTPEAQPFGLHEFIREFRLYTRETIYDPESRNNVENSGVLRLQKLLEANPVMFDTNQSPDYDRMLSEPTVIELDAISDPTQKTLVMAILVVNLMAVIRKRTDFSGKLRNLILIDEAHVLLNPGDSRRDSDAADPGGAGLKMLQEMTLIMRAYGTALFFGDQSPVKLTKEIFGNVDLKMMFRLDDAADRQLLAGTTLLTGEMLNHMVTLRPGLGYLACSLLEEPVQLQTPDTEKELGLVKNVPDQILLDRKQPEFRPPFSQCCRCTECTGGCEPAIRKEAGFLARVMVMESRELKKLLPSDPEKAKETQAGLPEYLKSSFLQDAEQIAAAKGSKWSDRLAGCLKIQMTRELLMNGSCTLTEHQLWGEEPVEKPAAKPHPAGLWDAMDFRKGTTG